MYCDKIFTRTRTTSPLKPSVLLVMACLFLAPPDPTLARQSDGPDKPDKVDKVEVISKRLEELEKRVELLTRENIELKKRFELKQPPADVLASEKAVEARALDSRKDDSREKREKRIEFGGEIRIRPEVREDDLNNSIRGVDSHIEQRVRFNVKARLNDDLTAFIQFQDSRVWGEEVLFSLRDQGVDLHQAYIDVNRFLTDDLSLRIGRQELSYGDERLVGAFDWNNVGRSFDAIKAVYAKKSWSADLFAARTLNFRNVRFLIPGEEDNDFFRPPPYEDFYGAYLKFFNDDPNRKLELYSFLLRDTFILLDRFGRTDSTNIYTTGTRQELKFGGGFHYVGEVAFQTGHVGPSNHRAVALATRVSKRFNFDRSPRVAFEYDFATGDGDLLDGRSREFIPLFPDNHRHHGYIDFIGWRNIHDFRLSFGFNPVSRLDFDADYHRFYLHKGDGQWLSAFGVPLGFDRFADSTREIGQELDLTVSFPYKEHIEIVGGYSVFVPGRFAKLTRHTNNSHFSYIQTRFRF